MGACAHTGSNTVRSDCLKGALHVFGKGRLNYRNNPCNIKTDTYFD